VAHATSRTGEIGESVCLHNRDPLANSGAAVSARQCNCGQPRVISGPKFVSFDAPHIDVGYFTGLYTIEEGEQLVVFTPTEETIATAQLRRGSSSGVARIDFANALEPNLKHIVKICKQTGECRQPRRTVPAHLTFKSVGCSDKGKHASVSPKLQTSLIRCPRLGLCYSGDSDYSCPQFCSRGDGPRQRNGSSSEN
jgi:hypothetical protein